MPTDYKKLLAICPAFIRMEDACERAKDEEKRLGERQPNGSLQPSRAECISSGWFVGANVRDAMPEAHAEIDKASEDLHRLNMDRWEKGQGPIARSEVPPEKEPLTLHENIFRHVSNFCKGMS